MNLNNNNHKQDLNRWVGGVDNEAFLAHDRNPGAGNIKDFWYLFHICDETLSDRINFMRKVFSIMTIQLLLTFFFTWLSLNSTSMHTFQAENIVILVISALTCPIIAFIFIHWDAHSVLLGLFTLGQVYFLSYFASQYNWIFMILCIRTVTICGLAFYAITSKAEATYEGGLIVMLFFGFWGLLFCFVKSNALNGFIFLVGCMALGSWVIFDMRMIIEEYKGNVNLEESIKGVMRIYYDPIIYLGAVCSRCTWLDICQVCGEACFR